MSGPLFWIIDEEWANYDVEQKMLKERYPDCTIKFSKYDYEDDLKEFGKDADAILCQVYTHVGRDVIEQLTRCKAIAVYAGGFDRVDIVAAKEKGIKVTNVKGYCKEDLADYVMASVYYFYKQVAQLSQDVKKLAWGAEAMHVLPNRISESNLLILGLGRIGQAIAQKAIANGMKVTAFDPYATAESMAEIGVTKVSWEEGIKAADYISVNMLLTKDTEGIISYKEFQMMKPNVCIINTARGKLFNEADLIRAAKEKLIHGAMLDVIVDEPPTYNEEIFNVDNIHVTPHISYLSKQSMSELIRRTVENAMMGYEGEISSDIVNP